MFRSLRLYNENLLEQLFQRPAITISTYCKSQRPIAALGQANKPQWPFVAKTHHTASDTQHYPLQPIQAAIADNSRSFSDTRANLQHIAD
jgi:hypothetical protein